MREERNPTPGITQSANSSLEKMASNDDVTSSKDIIVRHFQVLACTIFMQDCGTHFEESQDKAVVLLFVARMSRKASCVTVIYCTHFEEGQDKSSCVTVICGMHFEESQDKAAVLPLFVDWPPAPFTQNRSSLVWKMCKCAKKFWIISTIILTYVTQSTLLLLLLFEF